MSQKCGVNVPVAAVRRVSILPFRACAAKCPLIRSKKMPIACTMQCMLSRPDEMDRLALASKRIKATMNYGRTFILTSPELSAMVTSVALANELDVPSNRIVAYDSLRSEGGMRADAATLRGIISRHSDADALVFISHEALAKQIIELAANTETAMSVPSVHKGGAIIMRTNRTLVSIGAS